MDGVITEKNLCRPGKAHLLLRTKRREGLIERGPRLDLGKNHQRAPSQHQIDLTKRRPVALGKDPKSAKATTPGG